MDFFRKMTRQPIFQFMAIMIVLLITDMHPGWGISAGLVLLGLVVALPMIHDQTK
jgi:hypothetical protein